MGIDVVDKIAEVVVELIEGLLGNGYAALVFGVYFPDTLASYFVDECHGVIKLFVGGFLMGFESVDYAGGEFFHCGKDFLSLVGSVYKGAFVLAYFFEDVVCITEFLCHCFNGDECVVGVVGCAKVGAGLDEVFEVFEVFLRALFLMWMPWL